MADLTPATPLRLSDSKLQTLSNHIQNLITDLENQSRPLFEAMEIWQKNYEAKPRQKEKNHPWRNASNIVVPLCKMMADSRAASEWSAIHGAGRRVWQATTENEDFEAHGKQMSRYINWQADGNDFDFASESYDWTQERTIHGSSVLAGNWRNNQSYVYVKRGGKVVPVPVSWNRGPILEHVPRYNIMWDTSYPSIGEAPAVDRLFALPWSDFAIQASSSDGWLPGALEKVREHHGITGPSQQIRSLQDEIDGRGQAPDSFRLHGVHEVTVSWPHIQAMDIDGKDLALPGNRKVDTPTVDLRITIHRQTGEILRLSSQPYFYPGKPFFDGYFHKRVGRGHSVGMVKILEQLQAGMTTIFNQGIDSQTRANSLWGKTKIRKLVDQPIDMAKWIFDPTMNGVEPLNFPGSAFSNIQLLQLLQATAERLSGQADPAFGRETRLGGHSAPATTTLALLERGNTLAAPDRGLLTRQLGRAGEFIATLNQQFETNEDGKINRVLGKIDGELVEETIFPTEPIPGNFKFNIRGLSRQDNPDSEMQRQLQVAQQVQNYWGTVFQITQGWAQTIQAVDPRVQPVMIEAFSQALKSTTRTHERFLDAADIDDTQNFLLSINEQGSHTAQLFDAFLAQAREGAGSLPAAPQQGGVGQAGVAPDVGPAGIPGIAGGNGSVQ